VADAAGHEKSGIYDGLGGVARGENNLRLRTQHGWKLPYYGFQ